MKIYSNVVNQKTVREIQRDTLKHMADTVRMSFGPKGSITALAKQTGNSITIEYTKDGHTIVSNINYSRPIERSMQDLAYDMTRHVAKEVGDGTSSVILLCQILFEILCSMETTENASDIIDEFNKAVVMVQDKIMSYNRDCTLEDMYDIALIATNNNEEMAATIMQVYKKFGLDLYIDVMTTSGTENIIKEYDGMTIDTGYSAAEMANNNGKCTLHNPKIYCFDDPIDTPEMFGYLQYIIDNNIGKGMTTGDKSALVPTVIFCKRFSADTEVYFRQISELMCKYPGAIPLNIVSHVTQEAMLIDICEMCGAPMITKSISADIQKQNQEKGLAPTQETILDFCGTAELVESDYYKTKVIRPSKMFDENGKYSDFYIGRINWLEGELTKSIKEGKDSDTIGNLRRRLNSFKGNMVDFMIGGITVADIRNLKSSVEDAVFNCRSAAVNGVGYGANYMALKALYELSHDDTVDNKFINVLLDSYKKLTQQLYNVSDENIDAFIEESIKAGCPKNIRTGEYDGKVKSSIKSDVIILDAIKRILMLVFISNQYMIERAVDNIYDA